MENNQQLTVTGGQVPAFVQEKLASLNGALEYANTLLKSGIAPAHFYEKDQYNKPVYSKGKPEAVVIVLQFGSEIGMSPMQALQQLVPVNNLVAIKGDGAKALIQRSGKLAGWQETEVGTQYKDDWGFKIEAARKDTGEKGSFTFTVADAKRAGLWITDDMIAKKEGLKHSPWYKHPRRMLRYRALGFIARDMFSDVLSGIYTEEEADDMGVDNTILKTEDGLAVDMTKEVKTETSNATVSATIEKKSEKKKALAGATAPKVNIKEDSVIEDAKIVEEPTQEPEPTGPANANGILAPTMSIEAYEEYLKKLAPKQVVEEILKNKSVLGFTPDDWKAAGFNTKLPFIMKMLSMANQGKLDVFFTENQLDKSKLVPESPTADERGLEEQVRLMDKVDESGLDPESVAKELGYNSSEDMYKYVPEELLTEFIARNSEM